MRHLLLFSLFSFLSGTMFNPDPAVQVFLYSGKQVNIQCPDSCRMENQILPSGSYTVFFDSQNLFLARTSLINTPMSFPRKRKSNINADLMDPRLRGGDIKFMDETGSSQKLPSQVSFVTPSPIFHLEVNGKPYRGTILVQAGPGSLQVINRLPLEEYLYGVVGQEMPGKESEALKAQAVASRTLALNAVRHGEILKSSITEQVYSGVSAERPETNQAVDDTRGLILMYQGSILQSPLFFSTCGGKTEASADVFGKAIPYLQSVTDSDQDEKAPFCSMSPYFEWTAGWTEEQLQKNMESYGAHGKILDLIPAQTDENGHVKKLVVKTTDGVWEFKGTAIRSVLRNPNGKLLYSTWFSISRNLEDGKVIFTATGRGEGHGVGLCQWGAIGMAHAGKNFQEILSHYYTGAEVSPTTPIQQ